MKDMKIDESQHWYDEKHDLNVFYGNFPKGIDEFITLNEDGSYSAFIACNRCPDKIKKAYQHAVGHIINDDFWKPDVQEIERQAHKEDK